MKVLSHINELPKDLKFGLTIGNFDGLHLGHKNLLKDVGDKCKSRNIEMVVMTFVPHPMVILKNEKSFLLNTYEERQELLRDFGVKWLVEIPFTRDFSTLSPAQFLDDYVLPHKGLEFLFLGYDFAFGANKKGNHEFVKDYCSDKPIEVAIEEKVEGDKGTFSSSLVRKFLANGQPEEAISILGRPFFIRGRVIKGAGRGRQIGFPTANISFDFSRMVPQLGVYATMCRFRGCSYKSITNIGYNPTFNEEKELHIETNVFDFDQDIYGEEIQVDFIEKIRDEKKFNSVNELIEQIKADVKLRKELRG